MVEKQPVRQNFALGFAGFFRLNSELKTLRQVSQPQMPKQKTQTWESVNGI